eukprot:g13616.t1
MSESEISVSSVRQKAEAYSREICKRQDLDWDEDHERIENDYYEKKIPKLYKKAADAKSKLKEVKANFKLYARQFSKESFEDQERLLQSLQEELEKTKVDLRTADQKIQTKVQMVTKLEEEVDNLKSKLSLAADSEGVAKLEREQEYENKIEELEESLKKAEERVDELEEEADKHITSFKAQLENLQVSLNQEHEQVRIALENELKETKERMSYIAQDLENQEKETGLLQQEHDALKETHSNMMQVGSDEQSKKITSLLEELEQLKIDYQKKHDAHEESKQAHEATLNKLKKSQLDVVEAQMSEEEKYTKSARSWEQEKIKLEKDFNDLREDWEFERKELEDELDRKEDEVEDLKEDMRELKDESKREMELLASELNIEITNLAAQLNDANLVISKLQENKHRSLQHMAQTAQAEKVAAIKILQKESEYNSSDNKLNQDTISHVEKMKEEFATNIELMNKQMEELKANLRGDPKKLVEQIDSLNKAQQAMIIKHQAEVQTLKE